MPNFVNTYFAACLVAWIVDVIAVIAIIVIKPLRKWCWKKYRELTRMFYKLSMELYEEISSEE